jgi:hypothetical protein
VCARRCPRYTLKVFDGERAPPSHSFLRPASISVRSPNTGEAMEREHSDSNSSGFLPLLFFFFSHPFPSLSSAAVVLWQGSCIETVFFFVCVCLCPRGVHCFFSEQSWESKRKLHHQTQ